MPENRVDPRVIRSEQMLREALLSLLKEKPFRSIAIREITERAGLNRSTFYAHYRDRFELLGQCTLAGWNVLREGDQRLEQADQVELASELSRIALDFLGKNRELGLVALQEMRSSPYLAHFRESLVDSAALWVGNLCARSGASTEVDVQTSARFIVGGSVDVFIKWLAEGMMEPSDVVASRLAALIVHGVSGLLPPTSEVTAASERT